MRRCIALLLSWSMLFCCIAWPAAGEEKNPEVLTESHTTQEETDGQESTVYIFEIVDASESESPNEMMDQDDLSELEEDTGLEESIEDAVIAETQEADAGEEDEEPGAQKVLQEEILEEIEAGEQSEEEPTFGLDAIQAEEQDTGSDESSAEMSPNPSDGEPAMEGAIAEEEILDGQEITEADTTASRTDDVEPDDFDSNPVVPDDDVLAEDDLEIDLSGDDFLLYGGADGMTESAVETDEESDDVELPAVGLPVAENEKAEANQEETPVSGPMSDSVFELDEETSTTELPTAGLPVAEKKEADINQEETFNADPMSDSAFETEEEQRGAELSAALSTAESQNMGSVNQNEVLISDLEISPVDTNEKYSQLSFRFSSGDQEYLCFVTGLEQTGTNTLESWQRLAEAIAASFLEGETFTISNETAGELYGLDLDLIDAEKTNRYTGEDHLICWAASASDMLEFAGWNADEAEGANEDSIYQEFRDEFSDRGGYQTAGISWYLDGVNTEQYTYQTSGEIAYGRNITGGASQQQHAGTGGYWTDYAAAEVAPETGTYEDVADQLSAAADKLEQGYAVGLGAYFYQSNGTLSSGHALTVYGYVKELLDHAESVLRALFISDSDDRASGETTASEDRPNEYAMYALGSYKNESVSSVSLENYPTSYTTVIGIVSTLQPRETAERETAGTKDARTSPNLIPSQISLMDEEGIKLQAAEAGSVVTVETILENRAYQRLPSGSQIRYRVTVYLEDELVNQVEQTVTAEDLRANHSITGSLELTLDQPGEYSFGVEILEITDANGVKVEESYLSDNLYRGAPRSVIVSAAAEDPEEEEENLPAADETRDESGNVTEKETGSESEPVAKDGEKQAVAGEKIYHLTVVLTTDTEYELYFEAEAASPESFLRLRNRSTGETVAPENYHITRQGKGFLITFEEDFIRRLNPGNNYFTLSWSGGKVLIQVMVL